MTYGGNVTGVDGAIRQVTADGDNTLHITTVGTVIDGGSPGSGNASILAQSTTGNVSILTDAGTLVTTGGSDPSAAIHGDSSGGLVTITTNGNVSGTAYAGVTQGIWGTNTTGAIDIHSNGNTSATGTAILASTTSGNITINGNGTIAGDTDLLGTGDGISASTLTGAISITTSATGAIISGVTGIGATSTDATANNITIATGANIGTGNLSVGYRGIDAQILNAGSTGNISVTTGGTIWSVGTGIFTENFGTGNITVITNPGMDVNSSSGDGIDAFAHGGNVLVHLLDGKINSNTAGSGLCPSGPSTCLWHSCDRDRQRHSHRH
jgi:hypothetical protein